METIHAQLRSWGRSIGVVIPKEAIIKGNFKKGEEISLFISKKKKNPIEETFGKFKFSRTTDEILAESDREDWDE